MSLSTALDTAKSSLAVSQAQTAILSRNIANVNVVGATKKYANVVTGPGGGVTITSITQSANAILYANMLEAKAAVGRSNVIANGLDRLNETMGDTKLGRSPSAMVTKLSSALTTLSASPNNFELARNAANAASDLVTTLNTASETVQTIRRDADTELANAAADMTRILASIEDLNKRIVSGSRSGTDITDLNDQRDQAVGELSQYVAVTSRTRGDNDIVLYTDSGVTLFETTARKIEFTQTAGLNATVAVGAAFRIDGIPVTGDTAYMPLKGGSVAGLVALRDDIMVSYQTQLDEIARGLVGATKETQSGFVATGIFTSSDRPSLTISSTMTVGTFNAASLSGGGSISFDISYGGTVYRASDNIVPGSIVTFSDFKSKLDAMIANAVPAANPAGDALGINKIVVSNDGTTIKFTSNGLVDDIPLKIIAGAGGVLEDAQTVAPLSPIIVGLAATLTIAPEVASDPQKALRDGVSFDYNIENAGGYAGRLNELLNGLAATRTFAEGTGADPTASVADYAASSISWLQALRQTSLSETEYKTTFLQSTQTALSNETGVNMDEQLTHLTEIQRSYQASAKLITTIDEMLKTLLASI